MTILNEETKLLLNAVGGLAEILAHFREQCLKNGFTRAEALSLCNIYLCITLAPNSQKGEEQD